MELTRKPAKAKAPRRKDILNLAEYDKQEVNVLKYVIVGVIIAAAIFCLAKFGVIDRFAALDRARAEAESMRRQIDSNYAQIRELEGVSDEYAHYTYSGMTEDELALVSRSETMDMILRDVLPDASVESWTLQGNTLRISIYDTTLSRVNSIVARLDEEELVNYSFVQTAATDGSQQLTPSSVVRAQITAYLRIPGSTGQVQTNTEPQTQADSIAGKTDEQSALSVIVDSAVNGIDTEVEEAAK